MSAVYATINTTVVTGINLALAFRVVWINWRFLVGVYRVPLGCRM